MANLTVVLHVYDEEITNRALRAIVRDYTGLDVPVCDEKESALGFYSKLTGNPLLNDTDLEVYDLEGLCRSGVKVGNLLLVFASYYYDQENEPGTIFSVYLLPDDPNTPAKEDKEKNVGITVRVEEPNALAELIRARIWPDEKDLQSRYFGDIPTGVEPWTDEKTRKLFSDTDIRLFENDHPWGFTTQVEDIAVDIAVYWDGDGTMVMRLRQEGSVEVTLVNTDCRKDYGWTHSRRASGPLEWQYRL